MMITWPSYSCSCSYSCGGTDGFKQPRTRWDADFQTVRRRTSSQNRTDKDPNTHTTHTAPCEPERKHKTCSASYRGSDCHDVVQQCDAWVWCCSGMRLEDTQLKSLLLSECQDLAALEVDGGDADDLSLSLCSASSAEDAAAGWLHTDTTTHEGEIENNAQVVCFLSLLI